MKLIESNVFFLEITTTESEEKKFALGFCGSHRNLLLAVVFPPLL